MALAPDLPFPKSAGDPLRSKDWNDLVVETQRLDTAKVNRAGDAISGPLTIAGALGAGTKSPTARLHVVDAASPAVLKIHSTKGFGEARMEFWSDAQGSASEWRPGLIRSIDANPGTFTGALGFFTNGVGAANRQGEVEAFRLVNGNVGIGVAAPTLKVDIGDRVRIREGNSGSAGLWLYQNAPAEDRAFIGMLADGAIGLYGSKGAGWGLSMDVATGNVGIGGGANSNKLQVYGRVADFKLRSSVLYNNTVNTISTGWVDMPGMSLQIQSQSSAYFQILVQINGVQCQGGATIGAYFRLLVDGAQIDSTRHEFNHNGWELRGVTLTRLAYLGPGTHTITVQWYVAAQVPPATVTCCWYNDFRQIQVIEL